LKQMTGHFWLIVILFFSCVAGWTQFNGTIVNGTQSSFTSMQLVPDAPRDPTYYLVSVPSAEDSMQLNYFLWDNSSQQFQLTQSVPIDNCENYAGTVLYIDPSTSWYGNPLLSVVCGSSIQTIDLFTQQVFVIYPNMPDDNEIMQLFVVPALPQILHAIVYDSISYKSYVWKWDIDTGMVLTSLAALPFSVQTISYQNPPVLVQNNLIYTIFISDNDQSIATLNIWDVNQFTNTNTILPPLYSISGIPVSSQFYRFSLAGNQSVLVLSYSGNLALISIVDGKLKLSLGTDKVPGTTQILAGALMDGTTKVVASYQYPTMYAVVDLSKGINLVETAQFNGTLLPNNILPVAQSMKQQYPFDFISDFSGDTVQIIPFSL